MSKVFFSSQEQAKKPNTIINKERACPFCDRRNLTVIFDETDEFYWIENKFQATLNSYLTLIIESKECGKNLHTYDLDYAQRLFRYAFDKWNEFDNSQKYSGSIMFKNVGPLSGGSIDHPHMQIVGFENINPYSEIEHEKFEGEKILENERIEINISTDPLAAFLEYNFIFTEKNIDEFVKYLQIMTRYVYKTYKLPEVSYNLFFYKYEKELICKLVPRYAASPFLVGFKVHQIYEDFEFENRAKECLAFINEEVKSL